MRNFKDFTRAIAGIASALKGINTIVDDIPVPGGGGGSSYDITTTEADTGIKFGDKAVFVKSVHFDSWSTSLNTSQSSKDIGVAVDSIINAFVLCERATDGDGQTQKILSPVIIYHNRRGQPSDTTINFEGTKNDATGAGKPYDLIIYYTKLSE